MRDFNTSIIDADAPTAISESFSQTLSRDLVMDAPTSMVSVSISGIAILPSTVLQEIVIMPLFQIFASFSLHLNHRVGKRTTIRMEAITLVILTLKRLCPTTRRL